MANLLSTTVNGQLNTGNVIDLGYTVNGSVATTAFRGINFHDFSDLNYYIGKPAGSWVQPLHIHFYTGIWLRSHQGYGGTRFYNIASGSQLMSVGDGADIVTIYSDLTVVGTITTQGNAVIHEGNIGSQSVSYASSAGSVAWNNVTSKPSLDYQQEYTFTAPASTDGSGYSWVRISMGGFNAGSDFVRFSIARAIFWNDSSPYGGPSMDVVAYSREWHGGQEGAVITYAQHGSEPGSGWITNAGPRDLAGGGYWFYMRIWGGVDYAMRVYRGSGQIGTSWESTSDPGSIFALRVGVNNVGSTHTGFNTTGPIYGSTLYNGTNAVIHAGNIASQSVSYATSSGNSVSTDQTNFGELFIENVAVATKDFVTSQGYLTSLPSHNHDDRYYTESESDSRFVNTTGDTMTGTLAMHEGAYYGTITFGSSAYWRTGISQRDAGNAELRIWAKGGGAGSIYFATNFDGESGATTLPSDGMALKNNNLGIGGWGVNEFPSYKLHVKGTAYATSDFRAPIFYDSNDTAFYVDPNSNSRLESLNLSSGQVNAANNAGGRLRISSYTNGESVINGNTHNIVLGPYSTRTGASLYYAGIAITGLMNYSGVTSYDVAPHIWFGGYYRDTPGSERSDFVVAIKSGTGVSGAGSDLPEPRFRVDYEGIASATGSFRAPIFYDSNDPTYYGDFASLSRVNEIGANKMRADTNGDYSADQGWWSHDPYGEGWGKPHGSFRSLEVSSSGNFSTEPAMFRIHQWGSGAAEFWKPKGTVLYLRETPGGGSSWFTRFEVQGNQSITGALDVNSISDRGYARITNPGSAYSVNNGPQSGSVKIKLPTAASYTNSMMSFTVQIYNYSTGTSRTIRCGGYTYYTEQWYNVFAYQVGDNSAGDLNVRFGKDSSGACVWIGETNTSWSYPNIFVTDVQAGHSQPSAMQQDWSVSIVTSFDTVQTSTTAYAQINSGNIADQEVNFANRSSAASTLDNNSTISGLNFGGVLALTSSGANTSNSTGARLTESYGPQWNLSNSATWHYQILNGSLLVGISAAGANFGGGNYYGTGDVTAYYSDERLKTKVSVITNAIEKIKSLEGFIYVENDLARSFGYSNENEQAGVSAQQIQKVLPQAVSLAPFDMQGVADTGEIISKSGNEYLTVKYDRIVPLLIEGIKEQQKQIDELKAKLDGLTK